MTAGAVSGSRLRQRALALLGASALLLALLVSPAAHGDARIRGGNGWK
jgi:hypothetical protein